MTGTKQARERDHVEEARVRETGTTTEWLADLLDIPAEQLAELIGRDVHRQADGALDQVGLT